MFRICVLLAGLLVIIPTVDAAPKGRAKLKCYTSKETRDRIARLKLSNPLMLMRSASRRFRAQPLRSALCRRGGVLMYRFVLLRRDGKVVVTYVNARAGRPASKSKRR